DVRRVGRSGDGGIDLVMRDHAGRLCLAQCKRYRATVPPSVVRDLYGVMVRHGAGEAYLITTGRVTAAAQAWPGAEPLHVRDAERARGGSVLISAHNNTGRGQRSRVGAARLGPFSCIVWGPISC